MLEVQYSPQETMILDAFSKSSSKSGSDWNDPAYESLRKTIKDHYINIQDFECCICRQRIVVRHNRAWDTEHLISRSSHPHFMFHPKNLCVTCIDCNLEKSDKNILHNSRPKKRLPSNPKSYICYHPHFDKYDEHLKVIVPGLLYGWITSKGRKTISLYGLDRFQNIAERPKHIDHQTLDLMTAALSSNSDEYASLETDLLQHLILKKSEDIGADVALKTIRALNKR